MRGLMTMLKIFIEKMQRSYLSPTKSRIRSKELCDYYEESLSDEELQAGEEADIPDDVKEGQFVVFAGMAGNDERKRFVVELGFLYNPEFLSLLKQAEDEYGFEQTGALAVPCRPEVLQNIILQGKAS